MKATIDRWRALYRMSATAGSWIRAHRWGYDEVVAQRTIADIREKLQLEPGHHVLEVGCGCGAVLYSLLAENQSGVGVDFCEELLARAGTVGVDLQRIRLLAGEAARLPLPDSVFDRVLCYSVFQCFPSDAYARRAVRELVRVCRPEGLILIGDVFSKVGWLRVCWKNHSVSRETARALLALSRLAPLRATIRALRVGFSSVRPLGEPTSRNGDLEAIERRFYSRAFFQKAATALGCSLELLPQNIPGREEASWRFDVRIRKPSGGRERSLDVGGRGRGAYAPG